MKTKNINLVENLNKLESLKGLDLDGGMVWELVLLKKALKERLESIQESKKIILENGCAKDENGKPKTEVVESEGRQFINYSFDSDIVKDECYKKIIDIDDIEIEISINPISAEEIKKIKCSMEQMEALMLLTT